MNAIMCIGSITSAHYFIKP